MRVVVVVPPSPNVMSAGHDVFFDVFGGEPARSPHVGGGVDEPRRVETDDDAEEDGRVEEAQRPMASRRSPRTVSGTECQVVSH